VIPMAGRWIELGYLLVLSGVLLVVLAGLLFWWLRKRDRPPEGQPQAEDLQALTPWEAMTTMEVDQLRNRVSTLEEQLASLREDLWSAATDIRDDWRRDVHQLREGLEGLQEQLRQLRAPGS
jgi:polyhydroxyalkanoate synthesis regulator phasin